MSHPAMSSVVVRPCLPFSFSLVSAVFLHILAAAALLWVSVSDPLIPPQPVEVSLVTIEEPEPHYSDVKPILPHRRVRPSTPPSLSHAPLTPVVHEVPLIQNESLVAEAPVAEKMPDAPAASPLEPVEPPGPHPEAEGKPVEPPRFDAAYLSNPPPSYPSLAKRLGIEGRTVIRVLVDASGKPEQVELARSSGAKVLDEAALNAVQHWLFVPAQQGDRSIEAWVDVPIRFHLE